MEELNVEVIDKKDLTIAELEYLYDLLTYRHNTLVIGGGTEDTHELVKTRLIARRIEDILEAR